MRGRLGRFGAISLVAMALVAPAFASRRAAGTYSGAFAAGGGISLTVSADGTAVTHVTFSPTNPCGSVNMNSDINAPIGNHAFSYSWGSISISGSFPSDQAAQGSVQISYCNPSSYSWTATSTAPATPTPTPVATPIATPVASTPLISFFGPTTQRLGRSVTVRVTANERVSVSATGTIDVQRSRITQYALRVARAHLAPGDRRRLRMRISNRARRAIARALRHGRTVSAQVTVTAQGDPGHTSVQGTTIQLRRP